MADAASEVRASRIDLAATPDFDIAGLRVRPARRQVSSVGFYRELEPRVMQVLVALASARGEVVSRDRLIETCWDGRIVGDDSINRCIVALRHLAKDVSPEPFVIETVPRVGYCLAEKGLPEPDREEPSAVGASAPSGRPAETRFFVWRSARMQAGWTGLAVILAAVLLVGPIVFTFLEPARPTDAAPASIAVLPFRNLSSGEPHFAEGVAEEILGQLAREPHFRVAGRTSSSRFKNATDLREVGRGLNVSHVLEGSVRTQANRVRVNVALVQASDGMQLWSDSYDGTLDDIFVIQQRIGGAIAAALKTKLVNPALAGPLVTRGDVYSLYLTARGLLRTRGPTNAAAAADLLRRALELDPGYAPAWSSLSQAVRLAANGEPHDRLAGAQQEAARYARHALRLAPDLAEAHGTLGMILGFSPPEAEAHIRRAAELDPNSGEIMMWLGHVHGNAGQFERQLAAYRRAVEIEPLLPSARISAAELALEMGYREEAQSYRRGPASMNPAWRDMLGGFLAYTGGDFSEAVRLWAVVGLRSDPGFRLLRLKKGGVTLRMLGLADRGWAAAGGEEHQLRIFMDRPPPPKLWRARNRDESVSASHESQNRVAAKLMLRAGRHRELLDSYDGRSGLLGVRPDQRLRFDELGGAPLVALALRADGRGGEADRLLAEADAVVRASLRQPRVPFWLHDWAAAVWASQGKRDSALAALERAVDSGWVHSGRTDLPDIADEPVYASLRSHPRFERVRARIRTHMERERREAAQLRL